MLELLSLIGDLSASGWPARSLTRCDSLRIRPLWRAFHLTCPSWLPAPASLGTVDPAIQVLIGIHIFHGLRRRWPPRETSPRLLTQRSTSTASLSSI
jgi:hypothetical protein